MDEPIYATSAADWELEQRLDAYAQARLSLGPVAATKIRAELMREARVTLTSPTAAPNLTLVRAPRTASPRARTRGRLRRSGAVLVAAGLAVGVLGGTAAAAQPGGPLYGTRVWVEELTLPGDPTQRAAAELGRLERRLTEIETAAASGNRAALVAAVDSYGRIAGEALEAAGTDSARLRRLRVAVDRQLAVLRAVAPAAPSKATDAIEGDIDRALEHDAARLENGATTPPPAAMGGGNHSSTGASRGGDDGEDAGGTHQGPGASPAPRREETSESTPRPESTREPHGTARPESTPDTTPDRPATTPEPTDHRSDGEHSPKPSHGAGETKENEGS